MARFKNFLIGNLFIFIATLFWGLNVPADKVMIPHWISGAQLGVVRIVASTALVWLTSLFLKMEPVERADYKRLAWAGVMLFGFLVVSCMAYRYTSPVDIAIILSFPPLIVIAIRGIFLHIKVSAMEIVGIIVAFAGAIFLIFMGAASEKGHDSLVGDLMVFGSVVCFAVYLVLMEKPSKKYKPVNLTRWVQLFASCCCVPLLFFTWKEPLFHTTQTTPWVLIILIVLLPSYAAYLLVPPSIRRIGSDIESMYQYLVPVIATIASIAVGVADFRWYQPVAFGIILVGVYLANRSKFHHPQLPPSTSAPSSSAPSK